jgi:hypothetical protein
MNKYLLAVLLVLLGISIGVITAIIAFYIGAHPAPTPPPEPTPVTVTDDGIPSGSTGAFLHFTAPTRGTTFISGQPAVISWNISDPALADKFPDFQIYLTLLPPGVDAGEGSLVGTNTNGKNEDAFIPLSQTSITWDVGHQISFWSGGPNYHFPYGNGFKVRARLQYVGKAEFTCDPAVKGECSPVYPEPIQTRINAARAWQVESEPFSIVER